MHAETPVGFRIRVGERADLDAIKTIDRASYLPEKQYKDAFYASIWSGTRFRVYVLTTPSDTVVAYALLDFVSPTVRLRSLAVHPDYRRRGLGESLLRHVVTTICGEIDLFVHRDNRVAKQLYDSLGFAVDHDAEALPDRLVMRLRR